MESSIASIFIERIRELPDSTTIMAKLEDRYKISAEGISGEEYVHELADRLFNGQIENAGGRLLRDYGRGALGKFALELPP